MTKDEAFQLVSRNLVDIFEIEAAEIQPQALLQDDLNLDSIDAVDMMVQLQEETGKKVTPEQFETIKTVEDLVQLVQDLHG